MLPSQLTPASFAAYPPEGKALAESQLELLRRLPLAFLPLLLRELVVYDWKFPAERADLERQFRYLSSNAGLPAFSQLKLPKQLEQSDWVNGPAVFSEQLSAHLWATHQIDPFRAAATEYVKRSTASAPDPPLATHRFGIAIIGQGVDRSDYHLFRKLRAHGVYYTQVKHENGVQVILEAAAARAKAHPLPYAHWYLDGAPTGSSAPPLTTVSYAALAGSRATLQARMQKTYEASVFDPEAFRTMLAQIKPEEVGLDMSHDPVLSRFQLSLLTEGSGTQVFATTFVQWAAREALRRAQPLTLVARFGPRQREKQMNELLAERQRKPELDPVGSLVDADMGAYYTWLNQQRLPGDDKSAFLVWFEDHSEAIAISPVLARGARSETPIELADLLTKIA
jgi:hypothetical protein